MLDHGGRNGGGLAPKTVRNTHVVLRKALADAERLGLVSRNVAAAARGPVAAGPEMMTWTSDQLKAFSQSAESSRMRHAFNLLATTGMRRGEALGLRWSDIDFDSGQLSIVQTITAVKGKIARARAAQLRPIELFIDRCARLNWWGGREMILFDGPVDAVQAIGTPGPISGTVSDSLRRRSPQLWWPPDRAWFHDQHSARTLGKCSARPVCATFLRLPRLSDSPTEDGGEVSPPVG